MVLYFVFPNFLSGLVKEISPCLNPTNEINPLRKLCDSFNEIIWFAIKSADALRRNQYL